jgi:hypothetical protein
MTDDQLLLASDYLDDVLDAEGRARAEGDPEVMAEVALLVVARARLRAVDPPDPARRTRAIAAALDAAVERDEVATPIPLRARRAWWGVAAAVATVVVVVGGIAALRAGSSGDDDDNSFSAPAPAAQLEEGTTGDLAAGAAPATTAAATAAAAPPRAAAPPELDSPAALARFAATTTSQQKAQVSDAAAPTCAGGVYVGQALYTAGSSPVPVEVFVDDREAVARDAATCTEVARAPLP